MHAQEEAPTSTEGKSMDAQEEAPTSAETERCRDWANVFLRARLARRCVLVQCYRVPSPPWDGPRPWPGGWVSCNGMLECFFQCLVAGEGSECENTC